MPKDHAVEAQVSKPEKELLCLSKNGLRIVYDPVNSHAATHLEDTPQLKDLLTEAIGNMELDGQEIKTHVDMGRTVGTCDVVEVDDSDEIVYAMRKNREDDGLVPFTKTRVAEPSSSVAMHLVPQPNGSYELSSAWIGVFEEDLPFPQAKDATEQSADYWSHYAFVWGSQEIVAGTVTSARPW